MSDSKKIRDMIVEKGCFLKGEYFFALKKKENVSDTYINLDPVFTDPALVFYLGDKLFHEWQGLVDGICGPAIGSIPLIYAGAKASSRPMTTVWADKGEQEGSFLFDRMGFEKAVKGKRFVVFEDITSSGSSPRAVCEQIKNAGGEVAGMSCIWNRGKVTAEMIGAPLLHSLIDESVPFWTAEEHPQWGKWPIVSDIGHPKHFPDYKGGYIKLLG